MGLLSLAGMGCSGQLFGEVWTKAACGATGLCVWLQCADRGAKQHPHQGFGSGAFWLGAGAPVLTCLSAAMGIAVLVVPSHTQVRGGTPAVALVLGWLYACCVSGCLFDCGEGTHASLQDPAGPSCYPSGRMGGAWRGARFWSEDEVRSTQLG